MSDFHYNTHFNCSNECGLLLDRTKDDSELDRDQPNHFVGLSILEIFVEYNQK